MAVKRDGLAINAVSEWSEPSATSSVIVAPRSNCGLMLMSGSGQNSTAGIDFFNARPNVR